MARLRYLAVFADVGSGATDRDDTHLVVSLIDVRQQRVIARLRVAKPADRKREMDAVIAALRKPAAVPSP